MKKRVYDAWVVWNSSKNERDKYKGMFLKSYPQNQKEKKFSLIKLFFFTLLIVFLVTTEMGCYIFFEIYSFLIYSVITIRTSTFLTLDSIGLFFEVLHEKIDKFIKYFMIPKPLWINDKEYMSVLHLYSRWTVRNYAVDPFLYNNSTDIFFFRLEVPCRWVYRDSPYPGYNPFTFFLSAPEVSDIARWESGYVIEYKKPCNHMRPFHIVTKYCYWNRLYGVFVDTLQPVTFPELYAREGRALFKFFGYSRFKYVNLREEEPMTILFFVNMIGWSILMLLPEKYQPFYVINNDDDSNCKNVLKLKHDSTLLGLHYELKRKISKSKDSDIR